MIGVLLALVCVCLVLLFIKHHSGGSLFSFKLFRNQPGFDNACYDKTKEEVKINDDSGRKNGHAKQMTNGNSLKYTDFGDEDA